MTKQRQRQGRRVRDSNQSEERFGGKHWLGEGLDGQESLFLELDPFVFRADATICQMARSIYFELTPQRERLSALLLPDGEAIGYHLGFLSSMYQVYLAIPEFDELREAAAEEFSCFLADGELPKSFFGAMTLVIEGLEPFSELEHFRARLRTARELLAPEGKLIVVFHGVYEHGQTYLCWSDGSKTPLLDLLSENLFLISSPEQFVELPFENLGEDYGQEFLKRHRAYFGRAVRGALQQRMNDEEFFKEMVGANRARNRSIVCVWGPGDEGEFKVR